MNLEELNRVVQLGEGLTLEFKTRVPKPERIAKEVIAFANTMGGRLLLGVDDDGTIKGVRDSDEEEYALMEALNTHCKPPIQYAVKRIPVSKKRNVLFVNVYESNEKPHVLIDPSDPANQTAYVRINDMSVEASREHVRLMRTRNSSSDVKFEFGDKEHKLMRYLEDYGRITVSQFASLANISDRKASHTLVLLAKANVLQLHADPRHDYFTLAYNKS